MFALCCFKNNKGQALVEGALTAPLIVFFLFTVIWFGRIMLTWQQLVGAARYGTDMIAYTPFGKEQIRQDIKNYLCNKSNIGRILDDNPEVLQIEVEIHDLPAPIDYTLEISSLDDLMRFNPLTILETVRDSNPVSPKMSSVEISYKYKVPPILRFFQENIYVRARSEVLADSGSPGSKLTTSKRRARK